MSKVDEKFMLQAIKLAKLGKRLVAPNPMVGAIIVKDGKILGKGYHQKFGAWHAEVNAINAVGCNNQLHGATMYVTLEPCRHHGKTPPCQDYIESVGISRVVCGCRDPFQKSKRSSKLSYEFLEGDLAEQCEQLNRFFFTWIKKKRPFITVKIALSSDGFVAGVDGQTIHFTSKSQDEYVHQLRSEHQAIMVGAGTVLSDNPFLTVRHVEGLDPLRIILDAENNIPNTANVFKDVNYLHIKKQVLLPQFFSQLAKDNIASILVEAGPTLYKELKTLNLIDDLILLKGKGKINQGLRIKL